MLRFRTFIVVAASLSTAVGCASAPKPAPITPEEAALAAPMPPSTISRADDPAFNPGGEMDFTFTERKSSQPGASREAPLGTSMRADDSVKKNKQRVRPAAP